MGQKLWGISPTNADKPNWLTDKQKENTVATKGGWVLKHPSGIFETLVAVAGLQTKLGAATVTAVRWMEAALKTNVAGSLYVDFDEQVTVTGSPTIALSGGAPIASVTLVSGGTGYTTAAAVVTGDGFGAQVDTTITDGVVAITLVQPGSGYSVAHIAITGDGADASATIALGSPLAVTATYASMAGNGNALVFTFPALNNSGDTLHVGAQSIALTGGTIVETLFPTTNAVLTIAAEDLPGTTLPVTVP